MEGWVGLETTYGTGQRQLTTLDGHDSIHNISPQIQATELKLICYNKEQFLYTSNPNGQPAGLLMRPEHGETKAKTETETRECETEIETKNLLWNRDQKLRDRDQSSQVSCMWKWHKSVCVIFYYTHEVNDEPQMEMHLRWSVSKMFNDNN